VASARVCSAQRALYAVVCVHVTCTETVHFSLSGTCRVPMYAHMLFTDSPVHHRPHTSRPVCVRVQATPPTMCSTFSSRARRTRRRRIGSSAAWRCCVRPTDANTRCRGGGHRSGCHCSRSLSLFLLLHVSCVLVSACKRCCSSLQIVVLVCCFSDVNDNVMMVTASVARSGAGHGKERDAPLTQPKSVTVQNRCRA
jgi:hypothetical protein